jgi:hypothetical protein
MVAAVSAESSGRLDDSQRAIGRFPRSLRARALALVLPIAAFAALAGPGVARAAASPGLPGLEQISAEVQSALVQVDSVAPGTAAAVQPAVSQALATVSNATAAPPAAPPPVTAPPAAAERFPASASSAPVTTAVAAQQAVAPVAAAAAASGIELAFREVAPAAGPPKAAAPARQAPRSSRAPVALAAPEATAGAGESGAFPPPRAAPLAAALASPRAARAGDRAQRDRAGAGPAAGVAGPQQLPPRQPWPQGPDLGAAGQGGGQAPPLLLLLFGALAATFAQLGFRSYRRRLPRMAFRKPRRVTLPVWHPG